MGNRVKERGGVDEPISHLAQLTELSTAGGQREREREREGTRERERERESQRKREKGVNGRNADMVTARIRTQREKGRGGGRRVSMRVGK